MEKPEHKTDPDATEQKEHQKERGEMPTAGCRDKMDGDRQTRDVGKNEIQGRMQHEHRSKLSGS